MFRVENLVLVCVTGTIQPAILKKLLTGNGAQHFENGLVARFLMAMPPERVREWREAVTPDDLLKKYVDLFKKLFALNPHIDLKTGSRNPQLVGLSPGAKKPFRGVCQSERARIGCVQGQPAQKRLVKNRGTGRAVGSGLSRRS